MKIGIIGSGNIGGTLTRLFARRGHQVAVANSRGPETLGGLVAEAGDGARAATVEEAADFGDLIVVALPVAAYDGLPTDRFDGKVVVDAGNYYPARDGQIESLDSDSTTSSELLGDRLRGARMVKAFNTMNFRPLSDEAQPGAPREQRLAIFLAGDDEQAKATVAALIDEIGFAPVDTGSLADGGRRQQPGTLVYNNPMRAQEAEAALGGTQ
jgi:8-hydroxy-5-deazaflavin:NADPH oxidoreductase